MVEHLTEMLDTYKINTLVEGKKNNSATYKNRNYENIRPTLSGIY